MTKKKLLQISLPVLILGVAFVSVFVIVKNPPQAKFGPKANASKIAVEIQTIQSSPFTVTIESYGTVRPRTQSSLTSQVSGQIIYVANSFREGGFFKKDDVLIRVDQRDYQAEVKVAEADLILAKQTYSEESARADQAKADWQRLGKKGKPNDLVLRIPQLQAARASVLSAEAKLGIAKLALERTEIKAPFDGRVLSKSVDIGQVVSNNTSLANIYATDYVEIRLPIKNNDLALIDLPEENADNDNQGEQTQVLLRSDLIGEQQWQGKLVRTEGAIDSDTQQLYAVAQIDRPFELAAPLIKIGQYVNADIIGRTLQDAITIPNSAIYQGSYVYIENQKRVERRKIDIAWQNSDIALISSGLNTGEHIVLSPLGNVVSGTPVKIISDQKAQSDKGPNQ